MLTVNGKEKGEYELAGETSFGGVKPETYEFPHATKLDPDWISLMKEAQEIGLSVKEVRNFIKMTESS